jgi:hypothetical protein
VPINSSIALGVQPIRVEQKDPNAQLNALARVMQMKNMGQESDLNALRMDQMKRDQADQVEMRNALSAPDADPYKVLLGRGKIREAGDYQKSQSDAVKAKADAEYRQIETAHKRIDLTGQALGFVLKNPTIENATAAITHLANVGGMPQDAAQKALSALQANPTPENIARFAELGFRSALAAKEQLPKFQTNNIGGQTLTQQFDPVTGKAGVASAVQNTQSPDNIATNERVAADNAASRGVQIRGQNLTDARQRENNAATMSRPFEVTGEDGKPMLVQQDKQGNIRPVQGFAPKSGGKPMTEGQAKANLFGSRMKESDRILQELEGKYSPLAVNSKMSAEKTPLVGALAGAVGNAMLSEQGQKAEQAQRDFVNAVLRRESGAVISEQEFANAQKQYFPQPNDKPENLAQKRRNRQLAIQGLEAEVPGGLKGGSPAPAAAGGWSIQKVN